MRSYGLRSVAVLTAAWLAACGSSSDGGGSGNPPGDDAGVDTGSDAPVACDAHAVSAPAKFTDRSADWGLDDPKLQGWVISAADLNGDGYPDVIAHVPAGNLRGKVDGDRYFSVMMNEAKPGGGRHFVDRTEQSGYGTPPEGTAGEYRVASGAVYGDVDNDGDVDVLSLAGTAPPAQQPPTLADLDRTQLLLNDGQAHFTLAKNAGIAPVDPEPTWSGTLADVDLDGKLDAFIANWLSPMGYTSQQRLLKGDGAGTFEDISGVAGLTDLLFYRGATGITACDLDDDGQTELLVTAYGRMPNLLLKNDGNNSFFDLAVEAGYAYDQNTDFSDDQWFLCYCAQNPTAEGCAGAAKPKIACTAGAWQWNPGASDQPDHLGGNNFSSFCADFDGDGRLDVYNATIQHWWAGQASDPSALLLSDGAPGKIHFARPSRDQTGMQWEHVGVSWDEGGIDVTAGDIDNDGREDVVIGRSDYYDQFAMIFHQKPDGTFEENAKASGIDHPCAASPTVADFDRDGDLDVLIASSRMREWCAAKWETNQIRFYENDASAHGSWLAIRLSGSGTGANRTGIGARVVIEAGGTKLTKHLLGAYGHGAGQQDTVLFFGLGSCAAVTSIEVRWPDQARTIERFENVTANRLVELRQGDSQVYDVLPPVE